MADHWLYGIHPIQTLLCTAPERLLELHVADNAEPARLDPIISEARALGLSVQSLPRKTLDQSVGTDKHQGLVARVRAQAALSEHDLEGLIARHPKPFLLILDGVQDPHNLGACLRTADAAGVHAVIIPKHQAAHLSPVVHKVACGAAETIPLIQVQNLARCMRDLKKQGIWMVGASLGAPKTLYEIDLNSPLCIVLGAEGTGLRHLTEEQCDWLVEIPMRGAVSSLNVSVATGVCLYEALRQRG
ncbi:MAG: 23S rRNA (guanosine(2251)-2'-O)-methyltransferase RlmB [Gammaproteobacteria bacterium]|nr:23S rRNA (guanosine(2251)-2'-O)-methyltransferase RlmB [Gammaproteobacteria bacterium]MBP9728779.1 23S rRNA (guanosine(2251)-2'-O)-methyltransferase RlmB [Gammaproteobacteria bacterium]